MPTVQLTVVEVVILVPAIRAAGTDLAIDLFATLYAEQNELDHQALNTAITSGRMTAQTDT